MPHGRLAETASLLRQGIALELRFGSHSLEAMAELAETIETSLYVPGSLVTQAGGLALTLANPPLRVGAFESVRALVDGQPVPASRLRVRVGETGPWIPAAAIGPTSPLALGPGVRTEWAIDGIARTPGARVTIRFEFRNVAIPPLVWCELQERVGEGP